VRKAVTHLKKCDPVLAGIIHRVGPCRMTFKEPTFESLARSIVYQQLSGKAASTIFGRLVAAAGPITPDSILSLTTREMRSLGLSQQKATYIRDLACRTKAGEIVFENLPSLSDEEVIAHLTRVKGIGVWTAQMFLIFALRRPDVLPAGDLGIRTAMMREWGLAALPKPAEMEEIAKPWRPWCSVACWYLWRSIDGAAEM